MTQAMMTTTQETPPRYVVDTLEGVRASVWRVRRPSWAGGVAAPTRSALGGAGVLVGPGETERELDDRLFDGPT